jgi:hypothetical protein
MMLSAWAESMILSAPPAESMILGRHRVQLVGGLLLEPLFRGSKPSGVRMFLCGWGLGPHMSNQGTLVRRCRESHLKTI